SKKKNEGKLLCLILLLALLLFASHSNSLPLSTNKRWIVDEQGKRMKLHCVNWSSYLNSMVGEGLDLIKPLNDLVGEIKKTRFQLCLLLALDLTTFSLENVTLIQAFDVVIDEFGKQDLMLLADNHWWQYAWEINYGAQVHEPMSNNRSQSKSKCFAWFLMSGPKLVALVISEFGIDVTHKHEKNHKFM
ncbi:hypothetical protein CR513_53422, partial [Mucuna pruriens]